MLSYVYSFIQRLQSVIGQFLVTYVHCIFLLKKLSRKENLNASFKKKKVSIRRGGGTRSQ